MPDTFPPLSPKPLAVPAVSLKIITRTFGGKPLTILIGHEDFELIFIVNQVAEVCHIANPSAATAMTMEATGGYGFCQLREVLHSIEHPEQIGSWGLEHTQGDTWLASSAAVYRMLLRFDAPLEQFFYRWLIDDVLREVQEMPETIEPTDTYPDELAQLKATIRSLERRLNASIARERRLESVAETLDKNLTSTARELLSLRKGFPVIGSPLNTPTPLLDRVQSEFDDLSYAWRRSVLRDAIGIAGAKFDEHLYRSHLAHEKRRS